MRRKNPSGRCSGNSGEILWKLLTDPRGVSEKELRNKYWLNERARRYCREYLRNFRPFRGLVIEEGHRGDRRIRLRALPPQLLAASKLFPKHRKLKRKRRS